MVIPRLNKYLCTIICYCHRHSRNSKAMMQQFQIKLVSIIHFIKGEFDRVVNPSVHFHPDSLNGMILRS